MVCCRVGKVDREGGDICKVREKWSQITDVVSVPLAGRWRVALATAYIHVKMPFSNSHFIVITHPARPERVRGDLRCEM